jgi:cystathionine beta-lyase family protein involved in aluminum resistance
LQVVAEVMGCEACMARVSLAGAPHALSCALFACLRPGDTLLLATGAPAGASAPLFAGGPSSLQGWGIKVAAVPLTQAGTMNTEAVLSRAHALQPPAVLVQRAPRPADVAASLAAGTHSAHAARAPRQLVAYGELACFAQQLKEVAPACQLVVDNADAELLEARKPGSMPGVDLVSGSLTRHLGGFVSPEGGYVAGRRRLVERACAAMCAPGLSLDAGSVAGETQRLLFQGTIQLHLPEPACAAYLCHAQSSVAWQQQHMSGLSTRSCA